MSSPADWYNSLPKVTRYYLTSAFVTTCAVQFGIVDPYLLILTRSEALGKLELWRLLTNLVFFGGFGMRFIMNMFFLVRYSQGLETSPNFQNKSADYLWCLAFCSSVLTGLAFALGDGSTVIDTRMLAPALLSAVVYLWSRVNPTQPLSVFGLFTVQAFYFPWVLVAMTVLMGSSPVMNIVGIVAGHVYYFLTSVQGISIAAPRVLREQMDDVPVRPEARYQGQFGGHNWGGGRRLVD